MKRLSDLRVGSPTEIELLGSIPGDEDEEGWLHKYFRDYHLHGEWFAPDPELISYLSNRGIETLSTAGKEYYAYREGLSYAIELEVESAIKRKYQDHFKEAVRDAEEELDSAKKTLLNAVLFGSWPR